MNQKQQNEAIELRSRIIAAKTKKEQDQATLDWLNFLIKYYKEDYDV